jgi:hypothetical protein
MHIELDPRLLEAVVFLEMRRREQRGEQALFRDYRGRVDALYDLPADDEGRDIAFRDVHAGFFERLGFDQAIRGYIEEFPLLRRELDRITFLKAQSRREEGADLFVRLDEGGGGLHHRTAVLHLRAETFLDTDKLSLLLRRELYHVSDMVEPAFGYEPDLGDTGESIAQENLVRDRYRVLWNLYIDARLARAGRAPAAILQPAQSLLERAFDGLGDQNTASILETVSHATSLTHRDLLALAKSCFPKCIASETKRMGANSEAPRPLGPRPAGSDVEPDCHIPGSRHPMSRPFDKSARI